MTANVPPMTCRRIRAEMALRCLNLTDVASLCGAGYSQSMLSRLLNGEQVPDADQKLAFIRKQLRKVPIPREVTAA